MYNLFKRRKAIEMAQVSGVVEWAGSNKFGGYSIKVGGAYFNSKFEIKCKKGDTVEFDSGSTGKYCNKLKVVSSGGGSEAPSNSGGSKPYTRSKFPIDVEDGQRSIIRQNALTNARELYIAAATLNKVKVDDPKKAAEVVIEIARIFEGFTAGDIDAQMYEELKKAS
jgi:hypothetical protein